MLTAFFVVLPVFAIIAAGYLAGRFNLLGPNAASELNRFVVYLGLPALLFQVMAGTHWAELWQPGFIASFAAGSFVVFGATLIFRMARGRRLTDASIDGLNAGYANAGYIGFPLCQVIFGPKSFMLATIATILTVSVLFAVAIICVELGLQAERRPHRLALKLGKSLSRNPLLVAPVLGLVWASTGIKLPEGAASFLHMLGNAASPCALVSLGLFLAAKHRGGQSAKPTAIAFTLLKLVAQPAVTAICAYGIFRLAAFPAAIAVLIAALPTGTGPFMIAEFYKREAVVTSGTILYSTVASVVTLTICLLMLGQAHLGVK